MTGPQPIRIVLADDHPIVRAGIRTLLDQAPDLAVVGEADDGAIVARMVAELRPDVLVLDVEMPGASGLEIARQLRDTGSLVRILAFSAHDEPGLISSLLACGAAGYLTKDEAPDAIIAAVRGVARGETGWLSRRAMAQLVRRDHDPRRTAMVGPTPLSPREREVLVSLARGQANEQIATALSLSVGTVKNHITAVYDKLGVHTRAEATAWAWRQGLMGDEEG